MPALPNPKHERFVQGLFEGLSADAAYQAAGYKPNRGNAIRLKASESIQKRLEELQVRVAEKAIIDRVWVINALVENAEIALGRRKTKNTRKLKDSEFAIEVEEYDRDAGAANTALKLLGTIPEVALFTEGGQDINVTINNDAPKSTGEDHLQGLAKRFAGGLKVIEGGKPKGQ